MNRVYLLLGSNMGNRQQMLEQAIEMLVERLLPDFLEVEDLAQAINTSLVYETEPWGFESKEKFLNQAFFCLTELDAPGVLQVCLEIEKELGRERPAEAFNEQGERVYHSRVIDIDILLFDVYTEKQSHLTDEYVPQVIHTPTLEIPHSRLHERLFALEPLAEIAGEYIHPVYKKSIRELKKALQKRG